MNTFKPDISICLNPEVVCFLSVAPTTNNTEPYIIFLSQSASVTPGVDIYPLGSTFPI